MKMTLSSFMRYYPTAPSRRTRLPRRLRGLRRPALEAGALLTAFALLALWVWLCCQFAPAFAGFLLRLCLQPL